MYFSLSRSIPLTRFTDFHIVKELLAFSKANAIISSDVIALISFIRFAFAG